MAVFRVQKTQNYTIMSNHHLRNKALSLKAKGLLSLMLSLPEDWDYTTRGLASICKEGVDSVCATVRELEAAGYIIRRRIRDNILGKLSDSRYATLDAQYEKEQTELTAEISVLEKAIKSYEKHEKDADRFIALIDKYENFDKLTIAMLNEFIEKILVHERDRKGSIQTTQEVEIYFNFVGRFVPPAFGEVELTPEELEEIRKREERKDRLHQNYLKRKANGKQKEYEERTKAKKKAEIEARKQAIRTEDIARGVFIPVSSLPQLGPRKGA